MRGKPIGRFALFKDYKELVEYANMKVGSELKPYVNCINQYGISVLSSKIEQALSDKQNKYKETVSTIHKAKGLEWNSVIMSGDWNSDNKFQFSDEDARLLYVGVTRAIKKLETHAVCDVIDYFNREAY
jgi:superfamily I DNA/RNA helicase